MSFYLDDELIKEVNIEKQVLQNISTILKLEASENQRLYIFNSSDDESIIKSLNGGIRDMADEILQISLSNINNKSITVTSNIPFDGSEKIQLYDTVLNTAVEQISIVENSVSPDEYTKVIYVGTENSAGLTNPGKYNVIVELNGDIVNTPLDLGYYPALIESDVDVTVYGDKILYISFKYPIRDIDATVAIPSKIQGQGDIEVLSNIYMLNYGSDIDISNSSTPIWGGYFVVGQSDIRLSDDGRSLEIQYNNRSLPTGNHTIALNFTRQQNVTVNYMDDFYIPPRTFPTVEKSITVVKEAVAASPISVKTIGRTEVVVTFDKPVALLTGETNVLFMNESSTPLTVVSSKRVGGDFTSIKYTLSDSTPLDLGDITLKIGSITDAYSYATFTGEFQVNVTDVPAKIISVTQIDEDDEDVTTLSVLFSKNMKQSGNGDVENKAYYKIVSATDQTFEAVFTSDPFVYDDTTKTMIIKTELLDEGDYILIADGVQDVFGADMPIQNVPFEVKDYTVPKVSKIINKLNTNKIVIKYNERMALIGAHSAIEPTNYKYVDTNQVPAVGNVLPSNTVTAAMNNGSWVRLIAPTDFEPAIPAPPAVSGQPNPQDNYFIHIGYPMAKDIKYVTNASGNIYPLCDTKIITDIYENYDISKPGCQLVIMSPQEIIFNYAGPEELVYVDPADFEFIIGNGAQSIVPDSATILDNMNIDFTFNNPVFDASETNIELSVTTSNSNTIDIFGDSIVEVTTTNIPVKNGIQASLIGASIIGNYDNQQEIKIAYSFSKPLGYFNANDFIVMGLNYVITTGNPEKVTDNIYEVTYSVAKQILPGEVQISMVDVPTTIDIDGNPIEVLTEPMTAQIVVALSVAWAPISGSSLGVANNYIEMIFEESINPVSIISDVGLVTLGSANNTPWDGSTITVKASNFATALDPVTNSIVIEISDTNIGNIGLAFPSTVTAAIITLTKDFTLTLANNILTLAFANDETATAPSLTGSIMTYKPGSDIITADNKYVIDNSRIPVDLL